MARYREWHRHLVDALAALESLGAIRTGPSGDPAVDRQILDMSARDDPDLTFAALTPIGLWAVDRSLVEQGVPAPVLGELAGAELSELHRRLAMAGPELVDSELAGWVDIAARSGRQPRRRRTLARVAALIWRPRHRIRT